MSALRHDARALFAAAREDGPGPRQRAAVFRGVAVATGIAGGAAAAASAAPAGTAVTAAANVAETATVAGAGALAGVGTASLFSMKLLAIGALIGVVSTGLGVVLAVTFVVPPSAPTVRTAGTPVNGGGAGAAHLASTPTRVITPGAKLAMPAARGRDTAASDAKAKSEVAARAEAPAKADNASAEAPSDLAEEARLVTAARSALVAGDAARALALVQATRKLGARALEPEELGLEARALRALGRADDAAATELVLRRRYPESALAR